MFLYRDILKKSWKITWGHKYLWFFGFFAAFLSGIGRYDISFSRSTENWSTNFFAGILNFVNSGLFNGNFFRDLIIYFQKDPSSASLYVVFLLSLLLISFFILWMAIVSQSGLINNSVKILKSDGKEKTMLREGFSIGSRNFWSVLGINLIAAAFISLFAGLAGLPLFYVTAYSNSVISLLYFLLFILFIPLALMISFLAKYAVCYRIIKHRNFVDSIVEAIKLFGKNWLISIETALILFMIDVSVIFTGALVILSLSIPYRFITLLASVFISPTIYLVAIFVGMATVLAIIIVVGSALVSFKTIAWTNMFLSLTEKKGNLPKIIRIASTFKK